MGLFADLQAIHALKKIRNGKTARLSLSQKVNLLVNIADAKRNLSSKQYEAVFERYASLRKNTWKDINTLEDYLNSAYKLSRSFSELAPYEKYGIGSAEEYSCLLNELRNKITQCNIQKKLFEMVELYDYYLESVGNRFENGKLIEPPKDEKGKWLNTADANVELLIERRKELSRDNARAYLGLVIYFQRYDKFEQQNKETLRCFNLYIEYLINAEGENYGSSPLLRKKVRALCELLVEDRILTADESKQLFTSYLKRFNADVLEQEKLAQKDQDNIGEKLREMVDSLDPFSTEKKNYEEYIEYLVENAFEVNRLTAKTFVGILIARDRYGKKEAIRLAKIFFEYLIKCSRNDTEWIGLVSVLCGALVPNEVLTNDECTWLTTHYYKREMMAMLERKGQDPNSFFSYLSPDEVRDYEIV